MIIIKTKGSGQLFSEQEIKWENIPSATSFFSTNRNAKRKSNLMSKDHESFENYLSGFFVGYLLGHPNQKLVLEEFLKRYPKSYTKNAYISDLKIFFVYCYQKGLSVEEKLITRGDATAYVDYLLHEKNVSHKTLHRSISVLSSYWEYLISISELNSNIFRNVARKIENKPVIPTKVLNVTQVNHIFSLCEDNYLDQAIFYILFYTGMRVGELVSLIGSSYGVEEEGGKKYRVLRYVAKGDKVVKKVLNNKVVISIDNYLKQMQCMGREVLPNDPLLQPNRNFFDGDGALSLNRAISVSYIRRIFKKYLKHIGITDLSGYSAHSARTTLITSLIEKGCDIYAVSKEVGHADVATTQRCYDRSKRKLAGSLMLIDDLY
ncbi:MAG: tyrosine-type recombinase/integrase [Oligoflexia bacterium]|nr:tyrosine-type recombinase/integrase [Oligoflexia bacterium]